MHPGVDRDISVSGIRGIFVVQGNNASKGCKATMLACVPDYFPVSLLRYTQPCASIALATFMKPAIFAPLT